jgi:hypothetical protein
MFPLITAIVSFAAGAIIAIIGIIIACGGKNEEAGEFGERRPYDRRAKRALRFMFCGGVLAFCGVALALLVLLKHLLH